LADSIISDLVRMETRILISKALSSILGAFATGPSGYNMGYFGAYSQSATDATAGSVVQSIYGNAKGGVYNSPSLSAYSGKIVTSPTFFAFARGAGVMGEAGPEAIMPLSRGPDGKLGVKAQGGGTTVIVENHSDSQAQVQQSKDGNGNDLIRVAVGAAMNEWNSQVQRGGQSYKTLQQVFGLNRRGVPVAG
jgi:lambda family phage tail tape measure protein